MKSSWREEISSCLPLKIERVDWEDPQLTLGASEWAFNTLNPWRLVDSEKMVIGSDDPTFETALRGLRGVSIVACHLRHTGLQLDPCFVLSNGMTLEVFASTVFEPWTMRLPNGAILVAEPSDPAWARP